MNINEAYSPLLVTTAVLLILGPLSGCGSEQDSSGTEDATIRFATSNELTTLDPIDSQEPYTLQVIGQLVDGLVTLNQENELVGDLARDWSHDDDHTTWRFKLKQDVQFHDHPVFENPGERTLDAEDVRYSFRRAVSSESYPAFVLSGVVEGASEYGSGGADQVTGFTVVDSLTFEIELSRPDPAFLNRITSPWFGIYPDEVQELESGTFGQDVFIGTGPFQLRERSDTRVLLQRYDAHHEPVSGNAERVEFRVINNDQLRLTEIQNGNVDLMRAPTSLLSTITEEGGLTLQQSQQSLEAERYDTFNSSFIGFNTEELDRPLRRAISRALDRSELVNVITYGAGQPTLGTVPREMGYPVLTPENWRDLDLARELVRRSSYTPNQSPPVELLVHGQKNTRRLGELVSQQLEEVGISVAIDQLEYNTVVQRMVSGNTEAFALSLEYVYSAPAPILFDVFHSSKTPAPNFWRYENPSVDSMLARLRSTADQSQSNELARKIEQSVARDAPAAFLYQLRKLALHRPSLSNVAFNGHSIPLLWKVNVGQ